MRAMRRLIAVGSSEHLSEHAHKHAAGAEGDKLKQSITFVNTRGKATRDELNVPDDDLRVEVARHQRKGCRAIVPFGDVIDRVARRPHRAISRLNSRSPAG